MSTTPTVAAIDLGAESGRVMVAALDDQQLSLNDVHRFANTSVRVHNTLYWDILSLWSEVEIGLNLCCAAQKPAAIGIDAWGVDFALLDRNGQLLGNPVHYRDARTEGMLELACELLSREEIFRTTGIQFIPINSLYQLLSLVQTSNPLLEVAHTFLTIPDLLNYWLTGEIACEFSNATTTQCYNPEKGGWAGDLLGRLGIPVDIFPRIVSPGARLGDYQGIPVIAPACHDTGSAVAAVPTATSRFAYLSSGTWSLLGVEVPDAILSEAALTANLTNEGGVVGTFRLLKNIMGLWLVQQCRSTWVGKGKKYDYQTLTQMARQAAPFGSLVDPDYPSFLPPGDMPARIADFCRKTGQELPEGVGATIRCVLESLALKYRYVLDLLVDVSGQPVDVLHIIGGGSQNELLCQMAADATQRPVIAGPVEAAALGNALVQWIALGELGSIGEARALVRDSFELVTYQPCSPEPWDDAYSRFKPLLDRSSILP
jgi:rhamnulokinase